MQRARFHTANNRDPRLKLTDQIQKVNNTFYTTLNANTLNKNQYDALVSSTQAQQCIPYATNQNFHQHTAS